MTPGPMLDLQSVGSRCEDILTSVETVIVGKRHTLQQLLIGVLANGHILIEDVPGLAKTLMARCLAQVLSLDFSRIQFTPDLMPADVTGSTVLDNTAGAGFSFRPGPVFTNLLLADEINRTPPKTQAALLEAMQERQVTVEGVTRPLEPPFLVLATQNPIEYEGTYPLPEAQLDRFLLRIGVGYPSRDDEWAMLQRRIERRAEAVSLEPVIDAATLLDMQAVVERVHVSEAVGRYMVDLVAATRSRPDVQFGASPRGTLALMLASRAAAALAGRGFVTPEDVKQVAVAALGHRMSLRPDLWVRGVRGEDVVAQCLATVATPAAEQLIDGTAG